MGTIPAFGVFDIDRTWSNGFPLLQVRAPCGGFDTSGSLIIAKAKLANRNPHDFTVAASAKGMHTSLLKSQSFQSRIESLIQNVDFEQLASAL